MRAESRRECFKCWMEEVRHYCPDPILLLGTKVDLREGAKGQRPTMMVSPSEGENLAEGIGAVGYRECSALAQFGVEDVFAEAARVAAEWNRRKKRSKRCLLM